MGFIGKSFNWLHKKYRYTQTDLFEYLGFNKKIYNKAAGKRMLIYHGVTISDPVRFSPICVTARTFESHLKFYKKHFNVVSLDDYYNEQFDSSRFNVCITFDDGYANNHKYVLPLLDKYKVPASFFITGIRDAGHDILWNDFLNLFSRYGPNVFNFDGETYKKNDLGKYVSQSSHKEIKELYRSYDFSIKEKMMNAVYSLAPFKQYPFEEDYWLQMTAQQIKELSQSEFATIGSHSYYHDDLATSLNVKEELSRSKKFLEHLINKEVKSLAFPYGSYTKNTIEMAKEAGYSQLLAMDFLFPDDHKELSMRERLTINPFLSTVNQMHATLKGSYAI